MVKKFAAYYKAHKYLFILDMSSAVIASVLAIFIPVLTRLLIGNYLPSGNSRKIILTLILMMGIYIIKTFLTFIRVKWGHILGVR
ncbi:MAG: ABC transporter ATP-binding protein, partial [Spirochaetales bacterium]|nr:ABC transporter ATP-binding protein [Spirochaetales bacterium]